MTQKLLHITNGDEMTRKINEMGLEGDIVVWREMLCEGPAVAEVGSEEFFSIRSKFLEESYGVSPKKYENDFAKEVEKLSVINNYDEIVLWFEFDLFCHLNMMAAISFLIQNKKKEPVYLVCSSRLAGEDEIQNLSKLSLKQLKEHYKCRIELNENDLQLAHHIWQLYCSEKPNRLTAELQKTSNFEYLSSCIKAHLERFPSAKNGLNSLERNVLKLIEEHQIISTHHLLGYALQYQGYYGYIEPQMLKVLNKMESFFKTEKERLFLTEEGKEALKGTRNFYREMKNGEYYGGAGKYDFLYEPDSHKLLKL